MALAVGDWVSINGAIARVTEIAGDPEMVLAEIVPGGTAVDRPRAHAEATWQRLSEAGLLVQSAVDPRTLQLVVVQSPADVVVAALVDAGGDATSTDIRARITAQAVPPEDWDRWWARARSRIEADPRIDTSRSQEKRYRLLERGERPLEVLEPATRDETRHGRVLAFAPQLREARRLARKQPQALTHTEHLLLDREAALVSRLDVDPTDRFMAAELATWMGSLEESGAKELLADDILRVDLLRIPQAASRDTALGWALDRLDSTFTGPADVLRSAGAAGPPWSDRCVEAFQAVPSAIRLVGEGCLGWAVPGDEDSGPQKYPDDLDTFDRRVDRARDALASADSAFAEGVLDGALRALNELPEPGATHARAWKQTLERLAGVAWEARVRAKSRERLSARHRLRADAVMALIQTSRDDSRRALDILVADSYLGDPVGFESLFRFYQDREGRDPAGKALELVRQSLSAHVARRIVLQALDWVVERQHQDDPVVAEIASLAGALAPDEPRSRARLDELAVHHAAALLRGDVRRGATWFSADAWAAFSNQLLGWREAAGSREERAVRRVSELEAQVAQLQTAISLRTEALTEARSSAGSERRSDTQRQAVAALRPIAAAIADSYESGSLAALQDRVLAALARAGLVPVGAEGDLQEFDPERHEFVGDGLPSDVVRLISPGFVQRGEGGDDVILVPARVVAAPGATGG